jgi:hypothetical protein
MICDDDVGAARPKPDLALDLWATGQLLIVGDHHGLQICNLKAMCMHGAKAALQQTDTQQHSNNDCAATPLTDRDCVDLNSARKAPAVPRRSNYAAVQFVPCSSTIHRTLMKAKMSN